MNSTTAFNCEALTLGLNTVSAGHVVGPFGSNGTLLVALLDEFLLGVDEVNLVFFVVSLQTHT